MSRRSTFLKPSNGNTSKDTEDPFANDDLSLDFSAMQNNYGKRTGKFYIPNKWKRSPSGFFEYQNDQSDEEDQSITPQTKLKKLRKGLGLVDSSDAQSSSPEDNQDTEPQPQIVIKQPPNAPNQSKSKRKPSKFESRKSSRISDQIQLSFSFKGLQQSSDEDSEYSKRDNKQLRFKDQKQFIKSIEKSKQRKRSSKSNSYEKKETSKSSEKKDQQALNDPRIRRLTRSPINYNEDLPKISIIKNKSKSQKKINKEESNSWKKRQSEESRQEEKKKSEEKRRKQDEKRKSQEKRQQEEKRRSEKRKKSEERKQNQERRKSEERRLEQERTKAIKIKEEQQRNRKERKKEEQRRKQVEQRKKTEKIQKKRQEDEKKFKQEKKRFSKEMQRNKKFLEDSQFEKQGKKDKKIKPRKSSHGKNNNQKHEKSYRNRLISPEKQKIQVEYENSSYQRQIQKKSKQERLEDSFLRQFEDEISSIKQRPRKSKRLPYNGEQSLHESLRSLVEALGDYDPEDAQSSDLLDKAVFNTQSDKNTIQNMQGLDSFDRKNAFKKNKNSNIENKDYAIQNLKKKNNENEEKKKYENQKISKNDDDFILTESLKKGAEEYHDNEEKEFKRKNGKTSKQSVPPKVEKRSRHQFEKIQIDDIQREEKLQIQKIVKQNQKPSKKFKTNQNKKDVKFIKQERYYSRFREEQDEDDNFSDQNQIAAKKKKQERKQDLNRRIIREADKKLKKKDRPARVSPKKKSPEKKPKSAKGPNSVPRALKQLLSTKELKQQQDNNTDIEIDGPTPLDSSSSNSQQQRRYPQRKRLPRLNFWYQRPVYSSSRQLVAIQTKQVIDKIGFLPHSSEGTIQSTSADYRSDQYFEKLTIKSKDLLDFKGFGDQYEKLEISYQKNKANTATYAKYIEVYRDDKLHSLERTVTIKPYSGGFTIQNFGNETGYIQLILTVNKYYDEDED